MENRKFVKMQELVGDNFTVNKVGQYKYKQWDNEARKMIISETWIQGYQKVYTVDTDKGTLDLSSSKLGEMLESVSKEGQSNVTGRTFNVKSNGKTGMDIRYFLNPERYDPTGDGFKKAQDAYSAIKGRVDSKDSEDEFAGITQEEIDSIPF